MYSVHVKIGSPRSYNWRIVLFKLASIRTVEYSSRNIVTTSDIIKSNVHGLIQ